MTPTPKRSEPLPRATDAAEPLDLTSADVAPVALEDEWLRAADTPSEEHGAGGRRVLGTTLTVLAALWLAYTAWSAGRTLAGQPLTSPAVAQWVADHGQRR